MNDKGNKTMQRTRLKNDDKEKMKLKTYLITPELDDQLKKVKLKRSINLSNYIRKRLEHLVEVSI